MSKDWQRLLKGDPLPWLLEPENPSARYLTLRHLLDSGEAESQVYEARAAILTWPPVCDTLSLMDPVNFWGQAEQPFYGGAVSTHATLNLLAQLGAPLTPQIEAACQSLLTHGQHPSGGFADTTAHVSFCYTGQAIRTLIHFGYEADARVEQALAYLTRRSLTREGLGCVYADGENCQWGITKALAAFASVPLTMRTPGHARAIEALADAVLDHPFDFKGRDAHWLDFGFPLHYQADLVELCDLLARLDYGTDPRFRRLLDLVMAAQTDEGRWIKQYGTRIMTIEKLGRPSKWVTIRVLRTLKHTQRVVLTQERAELQATLQAIKWEKPTRKS